MSFTPEDFTDAADLSSYEAGLAAFRAGTMPEERFTPFRLQMGVYGQRQEGVQMVRVKLPGGALTPNQLAVIGQCVARYAGKLGMPKYAHITTRQDIQAHFVALDDTPAFLRDVAQAGLTTREACGNTVRNVTACFLSGVCPAEHTDVSRYASRFAGYFLRHPLTQYFPRKFKVTFSGCGHDCGLSNMHDIGFIATVRDGRFGFRVMAAGGLSSQPVSAIELEEFIEESEMLSVAEALMRIHFKHSDRKRRARARLKYVLIKLGVEGFVQLYRQERAAIAGVHREKATIADAVWQAETNSTFPVGSQPLVTQADGATAVLLNIFRGDLTPEQCLAIADAATVAGSNRLMVTPEQGLVIADVAADKLDTLLASLAAAGLQCAGARGVADVVACPGTESCRLGITSSRGLASAIRPLLAEFGEQSGIHNIRVKMSGCQHSCGQHHIADLGFHGLAKKINGQAVPHYQLHIGGSGRADEPFALATAAVPARQAPEAGIALLNAYANQRQGQESVHSWASRLGEKGINEILAPYVVPGGEIEGLLYDWSENQHFSTKDNKPGECAAAVIGLTDALLSEARYELRLANAHLDSMFWSEGLSSSKRAALCAGRALLVPFGESPDDDGEVLPLLAQKEQDAALASLVRAAQAAINRAFWQLDLADPATGVTTLRDAVAPLVAFAARRFAPVAAAEKAEPPVAATAPAVAPASDAGLPLLDLTGVACPMNFVKVKIRLATMQPGQKLVVILDDGQPIENVPKSLTEQGQGVLEQVRISDAQWRIVVEKKAV